MELKLLQSDAGSEGFTALIVPLWNWNSFDYVVAGATSAALIVPLWNWNKTGVYKGKKLEGFNCTFMELK